MKSIRLILGAVLATSVMLAGAVQSVSATDTLVDQEQEQKLKVTCEVGSYGQNTKCEAEGEQKQKQSVRVLGATTDRVHNVVDTSLDLNSILAAGGLMVSGVGAVVLKKKINAV